MNGLGWLWLRSYWSCRLLAWIPRRGSGCFGGGWGAFHASAARMGPQPLQLVWGPAAPGRFPPSRLFEEGVKGPLLGPWWGVTSDVPVC